MLDKKATELTSTIFAALQIPNSTFYFVTIQPIILKHLEESYLQGREDQINKVIFEKGKDGTLKFPGQKNY